MVAASDSLLGIGLYTPAEAALYARLSPRTVRRWIYGDSQGEAVVRTRLHEQEDKLVTFLDFVQILAIRAIRVQHKVSLQKIRQAIEAAQDTYGVEYPFAAKHKTFLYEREVIIRLDEKYFQISGKQIGQQIMKPVIELYMHDLTFNADGLADAYLAHSWDRYRVTMNPRLRFGEPLIQTCGYTARALWEAAQVEGGIEEAALAYGVEAGEVEMACRYFDILQGQPAA